MRFVKRSRDELIVLLVIPAVIVSMILLNPLFLTEKALFLVPLFAAGLMYLVVRWAMFDRSQNLGISAFRYWKNRKDKDGMSWTHGSK